mmetsp:Transcript_37505/g.110786  ORF Transcript_37505/g.110786 Transcript_37505/m.110786 type:complete len:129 (-) Transcript_37505:587-973(-)
MPMSHTLGKRCTVVHVSVWGVVGKGKVPECSRAYESIVLADDTCPQPGNMRTSCMDGWMATCAPPHACMGGNMGTPCMLGWLVACQRRCMQAAAPTMHVFTQAHAAVARRTGNQPCGHWPHRCRPAAP